MCTAAGIPVAGGHSIDSPEPIYGLVAIGMVDPSRVIRNSTARAGDKIVLTKPLGVGIYSAALKRQELDAPLYEEMVRSMTQLNAVGAEMRAIGGVHAMTDVTGFGLLGHLLEMCRGASLGAEIEFEALPLFTHAQRLAEIGIGTGGAKRNWKSYGHEVDLPGGCAGMVARRSLRSADQRGSVDRMFQRVRAESARTPEEPRLRSHEGRGRVLRHPAARLCSLKPDATGLSASQPRLRRLRSRPRRSRSSKPAAG